MWETKQRFVDCSWEKNRSRRPKPCKLYDDDGNDDDDDDDDDDDGGGIL
jgi:hypothetical protein